MASRPPIGRSVGSLLPQLTKKALEHFGFPAAAILTDWGIIAGADLAAYTAPERLRWPKTAGNGGDDDAGANGATLILRVEGPRALEVQHRIPQLIERINRHFGFLAITDIRILQAPLAKVRQTASRQPAKAAPPLAIAAAEVADDRLRNALEQLGGEVRRNQPPTRR